MNSMIDAPKRMKKRHRKVSAERDGASLLHFGTLLLLAAGEPITAAGLVGVAGSAPRGTLESYLGSCGCCRCAKLLIEAERLSPDGDAYRRFVNLLGFFFEEVSAWGAMRRAKAEEGLARLLGVGADS